jgi:sugar lactone lactonase YvrE
MIMECIDTSGAAALKPERILLTAAAFVALLVGCGDQDFTLATGIPLDEPGATPAPPRVEPVAPGNSGTPEAEPLPPQTASEVAVETHDPVVPVVPTPDGKPDPLAFDCSTVPVAPVEFDELEGFTSSEDFVFDAIGNYVGVDADNNLVRIAKTGEKQLWAPAIGSTAGMAMLPDGSVVFCETTEGALKRVYPNGSVVVVLGGLFYPNGLDVGPDGFIYVAENSAGRVRRVNPDTGKFSIVANGLYGPNGVAFSDDPHVLYVGSFEGSGVYKIVLEDPEQSGKVTVFARPAQSTLREQELVCADLEEGASCVTEYVPEGLCQVLANVVDCIPVDPCVHLEDGEGCYYPSLGVCRDRACEPVPPACEGLNAGDRCDDPFSGTGICTDSGLGNLYCEVPNPCAALQPGDACDDPFSDGVGTCEGEAPDLYCYPPNPCDGLRDGDACDDPFNGPGTCQGEAPDIYCYPPNVCDGLRDGDACDDPFNGPGTCQGTSYLYCYPPGPCDDLQDGDACSDEYTPVGVCASYDGYGYCTPVNPCDGQPEGTACDDPTYGVTGGRCGPQPIYEGLGFVGEEPLPDEGFGALDAGAPADPGPTPDAGDAGTEPPLPLICLPPNICIGQPDGARCDDPFLGARGTCQEETCVVQAGAGGIDGLGVDACGNVYASEYTNGRLWRVSPAGDVELLATLPSAWIPNIKWGRDVGGFSSDVMYVADRDLGRLFGVQVGVPGANEFYATAP